jgi:hypothetical protein
MVYLRTIISFILLLIIYLTSTILFSQNKLNANLINAQNNNVKNFTLEKKVKIYQFSSSIIKFETPQINSAQIILYNSDNCIVRTYLFNNLNQGIYEINIKSENIKLGKYTCLLIADEYYDNTQVLIQ